MRRMRGSSLRGVACIGEDTLSAFAEGLVDARSHQRIEEHIADCGDCRAVLTRAAGVMRSHVEMSTVPSEGALDAAELSAGTRVGRYVVESLIGRGAMGTVYAATDPDLDRRVAVKLLRADAWSDAARRQMRARLLREAQAMARLSHPEVIAVYDVGAFGDQLFVAMEYVDGETLKRWRTARHRSHDEILAVYERAGSGLAAAHEAGLVHRDFKPDNVLVGRDGRVRVTDFGLARTVDRAEVPVRPSAPEVESSSMDGLTIALTRTGTLLGTPAYMAPEQLRGGAADARSDVFSFCIALYEALYGERPFGGLTVPVLQAAIDEGAVRAAPVMTRVPGWVRAVLLRGLRAAPEERFASMRTLLDALRAAHAKARRRKGQAVGVGAVVLVCVALVGAFTRPPPGTARTGSSASSSPSAALGIAAGAPPSPSERAIAASLALDVAAHDAASARPALLRAERRAPPSPQRASAAASEAPSAAPPVGNHGALILE
jgi:serine/threonine protein kinase